MTSLEHLVRTRHIMDVFIGLLAWIPWKAEPEKKAYVQTILLGSKSEGERGKALHHGWSLDPQTTRESEDGGWGGSWGEGRVFPYPLCSLGAPRPRPVAKLCPCALGRRWPKPEKLDATPSAQGRREAGPHQEVHRRLLTGGICLPGG